MVFMFRGLVGVLLAALVCACPASAAMKLRVMSNRADLVSGGQAMVAVSKRPVRVTLGRRNVTKRFRKRADGHIEAMLRRLKIGRNVLVAHGKHGAVRLVITNHPQGGPVFAGPQSKKWVCPEGAQDAQCNQPPKFTYVYKSSNPMKPGFQAYDPANPAADVAMTTTDSGVSVPFIVRQELGYQDRDQYRIAALWQPGKKWTGFAPQPQFAHKLLITHGASCDVNYKSGQAPDVLSYPSLGLVGLPVGLPDGALGDSAAAALGRGYVTMSTALENTGHNCDVVTQAESLVMAKEHVIEAYGTVKFTIGVGCSGGSLAVQWVANAYPGIYDGILPTCSFPDAFSAATQVGDVHILRSYLENPGTWGPGIVWLPTQIAAVEDHLTQVNGALSDVGYFNAFSPTHACGGVSDEERYSPSNPGGIRCGVPDLAINIFGPRKPASWTPAEKAVGHGFAGIAVDNTGVQYGLGALDSGAISPAQFAELNAKAGGFDLDINPTPGRLVADRPALARAYRSGMINETNNLDRTAIIDCRGPDPAAAHDAFRAFATRARLDREHGNHDNQLIWEGPVEILADSQCAVTSFEAMDQWLTAVKADKSKHSVAAKVAADKPADLTDRCYSGAGQKVSDELCGDAIVPIYGTPRMVAGQAITTDSNKCRLKPLDRSAYSVTFTDAQWAQVQSAFPTGVCDFSKPGVDQQGTVAWQTYAKPGGKVIYGGRALGRAPRSTRLRR
ncbi:MAG: hypothetical protein QOF76_5221 [Solirubrobacteraceae bacterium]|jgi:hypothetical protein|nr:hypothetical protein [Solirubrobacteraceae bacterium]